MTREGGARWNHIGRHADEKDDVYTLLSDEAKQADDQALFLKGRGTLKAALDPARFQQWLDRVQRTTWNRTRAT